MWSVSWLTKAEVENIDFRTMKSSGPKTMENKESDLDGYLLLCSDASKFHLFEFTKDCSQNGFRMERVATQSIKFNVIMAMRRDYLRLSLAKKLDGLPVVIAGLQNSDTVLAAHILRLDDSFLIRLYEVNLKNEACIQGLDAFTTELGSGLSVTILALCVSKQLYNLRFNLRTLLQLTI